MFRDIAPQSVTDQCQIVRVVQEEALALVEMQRFWIIDLMERSEIKEGVEERDILG